MSNDALGDYLVAWGGDKHCPFPARSVPWAPRSKYACRTELHCFTAWKRPRFTVTITISARVSTPEPDLLFWCIVFLNFLPWFIWWIKLNITYLFHNHLRSEQFTSYCGFYFINFLQKEYQ